MRFLLNLFLESYVFHCHLFSHYIFKLAFVQKLLVSVNFILYFFLNPPMGYSSFLVTFLEFLGTHIHVYRNLYKQ